MKLQKIAPWAAGVVALLVVGMALRPGTKVNGFDLDAFGRLPVLDGGRVKPLDSIARSSLLMIRSKESFRGEVPTADGKTATESFGATKWLLDVLFRPERAERFPAFVLDDPDLLSLLGLEQRGSRTYVSFAEIIPHIQEVQRQAMVDAPGGEEGRVQRAARSLYQRVELQYKLEHTFGVPGESLEKLLSDGKTALQTLQAMDETAQFRPIPPEADARPDAWRTLGGGLEEVASGNEAARPFVSAWSDIGRSWQAQDPKAFNAAVGSLTELVKAAHPAEASQGRWELVFNRADPFLQGIVLYVLALLTVFVAFLWRPGIFRPAAFVFLVAGVAVHTAGIVARVVLGGYPPVTNLYSSAVVVGWVAVVVGVVLELLYRRGFGTLVASVIGLSTLIIAVNLKDKGDTMEMMRAVLDNNFWLSTHVLTIIIGYAGTFLAGLIAIAATLFRHLVPYRDRSDDKLLSTMTYGVVCFALFFSFIGTVLGGIWADQSWGRFWGWDPKENGALLIVLWNAVILHARWGGYARERGIAAMAIFGNVITALSWFGVNLLGVGLHSYGFMDKGVWILAGFCFSQVVLMAVALLPDYLKPAAVTASRAPATPAVHS
jgi:ABC-type transport system involved in cytochrome c biogenesis permease subunit